MEITSVLVLITLALFALLVYEHSKRSTAEAANDNLESKEQVNDIQKEVSKNEGLIAAEKQKQDELKRKLDEEKNKDVSNDNLLDFFNRDRK